MVAVLLGFVASCGGRQPAAIDPAPAPGGAAAVPAEAPASDYPYSAEDVAFMQGMIAHHAQALVMTDMVPSHTDSEDLHRLAERIEVTQRTEIRRMQRWLEQRGEAVRDPDAAGPGRHPMHMPGMLSEEQMARLAQATGRRFDRLFLEYMIQHHRGALVMVDELFATERGGQEPEIYLFASDVDADQRAEIARMERMLNTLERGS